MEILVLRTVSTRLSATGWEVRSCVMRELRQRGEHEKPVLHRTGVNNLYNHLLRAVLFSILINPDFRR